MKTITSISITTAAALAGVLLVKFGNASFLAGLPAEKFFLAAAGVAMAAFAAYDYSREFHPLRVPAPVARPSLPSSTVPASGRCARQAA